MGLSSAAMDAAPSEGDRSVINLAHTAYDATRTYRNRRGVDVAYAGTAEAIIHLGAGFPDWFGFGSPTQEEGLFLLVAPGYRPDEVALDPGVEGWLAMEVADIAEFTVD